ncbi:MAG: transglutaminase family protein [Bdellovibrionota bacterium]
MKIPLRRLFPATALSCEALGIAALYLCPEVPRFSFYVPLALAFAALVVKLRDFWLLPLIAAVVLGGILSGVYSNVSGAIAVAVPMLAVHGITWLASEQNRYRYWRIGLAFLEMILAAILAPEAHMFFLIFFFVIMVSLTLSFGFLEQNFTLRDPAGLNRPLRPAYVGAVLLLSFVIFLSSLAIFPILPRKENMEMTSFGAMPGYQEEVSFQTATFYWTGDESRAVMWLFLPKGKSWAEALPFGLLRGKSLERFNGKTWKTGIKHGKSTSEVLRPDWQVEILRDQMPTESLPSPYGTESMEVSEDVHPYRYETGEWFHPTARNRRITYIAGVNSNAARDNVVDPSESQLPKEGFTRVEALAHSLQKNTRNDRDRVTAVTSYFLSGKFSAQKVPVSAASDTAASPIEKFLFETKSGHCELFATAAALLLRGMGLPTRLVVGFRAPVYSNAKVLTVRNGDAHAWVEVHTSEGWIVIDPTPAIPIDSSRFQALRDMYDWISAYWQRYILSYEFNVERIFKGFVIALGGMALLLLLAGSLKLLRKLLVSNIHEPRRGVSAARKFLQRKLKINSDWQLPVSLANIPGGEDWWRDYERMRFGPDLPDPEKCHALKLEAKALVRKFARAKAPDPAIPER